MKSDFQNKNPTTTNECIVKMEIVGISTTLQAQIQGWEIDIYLHFFLERISLNFIWAASAFH